MEFKDPSFPLLGGAHIGANGVTSQINYMVWQRGPPPPPEREGGPFTCPWWLLPAFVADRGGGDGRRQHSLVLSLLSRVYGQINCNPPRPRPLLSRSQGIPYCEVSNVGPSLFSLVSLDLFYWSQRCSLRRGTWWRGRRTCSCSPWWCSRGWSEGAASE